jgi:hypothetical protein
MTSADRNDLMPAQLEKLEWVTPKISLMDTQDTLGKPPAGAETPGNYGPSWPIIYLKPRHAYKNQLLQRVCKDPFLVSGGHLRYWLPGTDAADFELGGRAEGAADVLFASR